MVTTNKTVPKINYKEQLSNIISALAFNIRHDAEKLEKLKSTFNNIDIKEINEKEWKELLAEILKRLKECTSVSIVFDDLMMEVERLIKQLKNSKD